MEYDGLSAVLNKDGAPVFIAHRSPCDLRPTRERTGREGINI